MSEKQTRITPDNLPLDVREHLMRGQHTAAVNVLVDSHQLNKTEAEKIIEDYRQNLRERKIALDIQMMNEQHAKESQETFHLWWRWGMRIFLLVACLVLIFMLAGTHR